jgi:predicted DNA-binding transcriptional regulator AlpA
MGKHLPHDTEIISTQTVARMAGVTMRTIHKYREEGSIPAPVRIEEQGAGKSTTYWYEVSAILNWLGLDDMPEIKQNKERPKYVRPSNEPNADILRLSKAFLSGKFLPTAQRVENITKAKRATGKTRVVIVESDWTLK